MTTNTNETRLESDSVGSIAVPLAAYWGAQTQRSLEHSAIGQERMPLKVIHALGVLKDACALVNTELGLLPAASASLLCAAAKEVASGALDNQFPLSVWQAGSGTQTNMNVNEVIAGRANEQACGERGGKFPVHPNDHVNLSQSSNDAFSTGMYLAAAQAVNRELLPELYRLADILKRRDFINQRVVKIGRAHLQDASPIAVDQEFSAWISLITRDITYLEKALLGLYELAIGGTAVGTETSVPPQFELRVIQELATFTGLPFSSHPDKFAGLHAHDELVYASGMLQILAGSLLKIADDIRLLASRPSNGPCSSTMTGEVNPTLYEALMTVAVQVYGNHAAIAFATSQGNLQLNAFKPVLIYNFLQSVTLLTDATHTFITYLVEGLTLDEERIAYYVTSSLMLVTALSPQIGYENATRVAHTAFMEKISLRAASQKLGFLSVAEFDALVCPKTMAGLKDWQ